MTKYANILIYTIVIYSVDLFEFENNLIRLGIEWIFNTIGS